MCVCKRFTLGVQSWGCERNLLGHAFNKQDFVWLWIPLQLFPPFWGGGLVHDRFRVLVPVPHVLEHADHVAHNDQRPLTEKGSQENSHVFSQIIIGAIDHRSSFTFIQRLLRSLDRLLVHTQNLSAVFLCFVNPCCIYLFIFMTVTMFNTTKKTWFTRVL